MKVHILIRGGLTDIAFRVWIEKESSRDWQQAVHPQAMQKFKHRVRELSDRPQGVSMEVKIKELTQYLRGWMHYFGIAVT